MAKKRVFISFKAEDQKQVNGLRLLNANDDFDIEFYDESVRVEIKSNDAAYIRRKIREKIDKTTVTVCMVSADTHTSDWVNWELEESYERGNKVIFMGLKDGPTRLTLPKAGRDRKAPWHLWDYKILDQLIKAG